MKNIVILFFALILVSCSNKIGKENFSSTSFVPAFPDVPLPEGYEVDPTAGSFFDTAEGRIAETYAAGFEELENVVAFYKSTMPQLGWEEIEELVFYKEGELLILTPEKGDYLNTVQYQLKPANIIR